MIRYAYLLFLLLNIYACNRSKTNTTFHKEDFIGEWELTSTSHDNNMYSEAYSAIYKITADSIYISYIGNEINTITFGFNYTYGSNILAYNFLVDLNLKIKSINKTTMICDNGLSGDSKVEHFVFKKIQ